MLVGERGRLGEETGLDPVEEHRHLGGERAERNGGLVHRVPTEEGRLIRVEVAWKKLVLGCL